MDKQVKLLGSKMAYCRNMAKLTQREMCELLNVERSLLSKYENGVSEPPLKVLLNFAMLFEISMENLADDDFDMDSFMSKYAEDFFKIFIKGYQIYLKKFK